MLGYILWHQLFVYSCFTCLLSARLFMLLLFSCLFIMLFSYPMFAVILLLFCAHYLYARAVLFTHTHSLGRLWRPWIACPGYWISSYIVQVFVELVRFVGSWTFSLLILVYFPFFTPAIIFWFLYITLSFYFIPYFIWDHV